MLSLSVPDNISYYVNVRQFWNAEKQLKKDLEQLEKSRYKLEIKASRTYDADWLYGTSTVHLLTGPQFYQHDISIWQTIKKKDYDEQRVLCDYVLLGWYVK